MFTGLVQSTGTVEQITPLSDGAAAAAGNEGAAGDEGSSGAAGTVRLKVAAPALAAQLKLGDSIAVSGVCLTALEPTSTHFFAELAQETVERTSLASLAPGSLVNLELPTPAGTPLGGHIVQGHVDSTGSLLALERISPGARSDWRLRVAVPPAVGRFVVEKGSVTIEGISLTVARWFPERDAQDDTPTGAGELHVAIIPHTYESTNLHRLQPGDPVNLEADVLMKLAIGNGMVVAGHREDQWTRVAEQDTAGDTPFEVTIPYLIANGY